MVAADSEGSRAALPPVPGVIALGWLVLMKPLALRRMLEAWSFTGWVTWRALWQSRAAGDPVARELNRRGLLGLGIWVPVCTWVAMGLASMAGVEVTWSDLVSRLVPGFLTTLLLGFIASFGSAMAFGGIYGLLVVSGDAMGSDVIEAVGKGLAFGTACVVGVALYLRRAAPPLAVLALAGFIAAYVAWRQDPVLGAIEALALVVAALRLPFLVVEVGLMLALRVMQRVVPSAGPRLAVWLPFRWDDLIAVPLPGLRGFLVDLAAQDRGLAEALIDEAAVTIGQEGAALQARAALGGGRVEAVVMAE